MTYSEATQRNAIVARDLLTDTPLWEVVAHLATAMAADRDRIVELEQSLSRLHAERPAQTTPQED